MFRKYSDHRVASHRPARPPGMSDIALSREIRAEASTWLARLHADNRDPADEAAFRDWLNGGPAQAAAFEAVDQVWNDVGGLTNLRPGAPQRE